MMLRLLKPLLYMVDDRSALFQSSKLLLEASGYPVRQVEDVNAFSQDFFGRNIVRPCDAVMLDLSEAQAGHYALINILMSMTERPHLILLTDERCGLAQDDGFQAERVSMLAHPFRPQDVVELVDGLL